MLSVLLIVLVPLKILYLCQIKGHPGIKKPKEKKLRLPKSLRSEMWVENTGMRGGHQRLFLQGAHSFLSVIDLLSPWRRWYGQQHGLYSDPDFSHTWPRELKMQRIMGQNLSRCCSSSEALRRNWEGSEEVLIPPTILQPIWSQPLLLPHSWSNKKRKDLGTHSLVINLLE